AAADVYRVRTRAEDVDGRGGERVQNVHHVAAVPGLNRDLLYLRGGKNAGQRAVGTRPGHVIADGFADLVVRDGHAMEKRRDQADGDRIVAWVALAGIDVVSGRAAADGQFAGGRVENRVGVMKPGRRVDGVAVGVLEHESVEIGDQVAAAE